MSSSVSMSLLAARQGRRKGEGGETGTICQEGRNSQASKGMMMIDEVEETKVLFFFFGLHTMLEYAWTQRLLFQRRLYSRTMTTLALLANIRLIGE